MNQSLPSGPVMIPKGTLNGVGTAYSDIAPLMVIRPMLLPPSSVNHRFLSAPAVMPCGRLFGVGMGYSKDRGGSR